MEFIDYSGVYQIAIPIVIIAIVFEVIFSISRNRELYKAGDFFWYSGTSVWEYSCVIAFSRVYSIFILFFVRV